MKEVQNPKPIPKDELDKRVEEVRRKLLPQPPQERKPE
jgi:hypothetical protein